jgi:SNF family Na+-dependent transporter
MLMVKANTMQLASKIKTQTPTSLATIAFYGVVGILLLVLLPLSGFPPHIGLMGITSLIAAYSLLMQRKWATWLVVALFFVASTFTLYTLYFVIASDALTSAGMIAYAVLTWLFTLIVIKKPKEY